MQAAGENRATRYIVFDVALPRSALPGIFQHVDHLGHMKLSVLQEVSVGKPTLY
jgi:hypothetical protein